MDTQNLNIAPENGGSDNKSEKAAKAKKVAGKAAQFAAAAGMGVAGTMAANAINPDKEELEQNEDVTVPEVEHPVEEPAETPEEFDPNDIMIEDVEEADIDEDDIEHSPDGSREDGEDVIDGPQPITIEDGDDNGDVAIIDVDNNDVEPLDVMYGGPGPDVFEDMYGGPDGWDNFDDPSSLLADDTDIDQDPDILNDILNA